MTHINLKSENLVESLIKRANGSTVDFGYHGAKKVSYTFKPVDPEDNQSPHVADVANEKHYNQLIAVTEGFRAYDPDDYQPVDAIIMSDATDEPKATKNDFDDLLSVDPETVSNNWLGEFAVEILKIKPTQKAALAEYLKTTYEVEVEKSTTANEIIRLILINRIEEEKAASKASDNE